MPSRLANLVSEPPEKRNIGLRKLLAREFGSHLLIIAQALVIAKPLAADETKSAVLPVCKLSSCASIRRKHPSLTNYTIYQHSIADR